MFEPDDLWLPDMPTDDEIWQMRTDLDPILRKMITPKSGHPHLRNLLQLCKPEDFDMYLQVNYVNQEDEGFVRADDLIKKIQTTEIPWSIEGEYCVGMLYDLTDFAKGSASIEIQSDSVARAISELQEDTRAIAADYLIMSLCNDYQPLLNVYYSITNEEDPHELSERQLESESVEEIVAQIKRLMEVRDLLCNGEYGMTKDFPITFDNTN